MVKKKTSAKCGKVLRRQSEEKRRIKILCSSKDSTGSEQQAREDRAWQRIRQQKQKKIKKEKKAVLPRKLISKVPHKHKTLPLWSRKVKWKERERETVYNTKFGNPVVYTSFP
jgi:hypothetical protein